jgi:hypothetical protein
VNHIPKLQDLERAHGLTWSQLISLEPRLEELLWQARAEGARCRCWQDVERVFAPFTGALADLVGFRCRRTEHPLLGSIGAYEIAYLRLRDAVCGLLPRRAGMEDGTRSNGCTQRHGRSTVCDSQPAHGYNQPVSFFPKSPFHSNWRIP